MISRHLINISLALFTCWLISVPVCATQQAKLHHINGNTMGNKYTITLSSNLYSAQKAFALRNQIESELEKVNSIMSTWRDDSEISQLNVLAANQEMYLSAPLAQIINESLVIEKMTHGAFDITIAPLVKLWGFGPNGIPNNIPEASVIKETKKYTGSALIQLYNNRFIKKDNRVQLDLSGIAKGYGVDVLAQVLDSHGYHDYLIDIGGEIFVKGNKPDGSPWTIGIEDPRKANKIINTRIKVDGMAVATSGDYRNYFEFEGGRYSHVIDPKTGWASPTNVVSATVIAPQCSTADAFATAAMVMGAKQAIEVATKHNIALMVIEDQFGTVKVHRSPAFEPFTQ